MDKIKNKTALPKISSRILLASGALLLIIILLMMVVIQLTTHKRSVAAYCQVYTEEKARLAKLPGSTWPSGVFNETVGDASEFATSFSRLEQVAPDDIRPDVATLQSIYQRIHDDPAQAISASLSGTGAEASVKSWTNEHCTD